MQIYTHEVVTSTSERLKPCTHLCAHRCTGVFDIKNRLIEVTSEQLLVLHKKGTVYCV